MTEPIKIKRYGWSKQLPDFRDYKYKLSAPVKQLLNKLPSSVDLRPQMPPVYDQGDLGSCVSNAVGAAMEFERLKQRESDITPSRLFIYYNGRALENTVSFDSGLFVRDGIKTVAKQGVCPESEWPYNISKFATRPTSACYTDALKFTSLNYFSLNQNLITFKDCLNSGFPITFGFTVYSSFETTAVDTTGIVPMPARKDSVLGGHSVLLVGYSDSTSRFIFRNSWGSGWGDRGYGYLPYNYVTNPNLASDFWTIRVVN